MCQMLDVAHQCAAMALWMVILVLRETIVDQDGCATLEPLTEAFNPAFGLEVDL